MVGIDDTTVATVYVYRDRVVLHVIENIFKALIFINLIFYLKKLK